MAGNNSNLGAAKRAKNDEFYTQLTDIEKELRHYRKHFEDKTVLCNCDDPFESNFFKFFVLNFKRLGLKKLIATCYEGSAVAEYRDGKAKPYKAVVTTVHDTTGDGGVDMEDVRNLFELGENELVELEGNGDFRSEECLALLDEADIVVTNPPFSLFREYVATLMEHGKKFIIIGNSNAITYKEIFSLMMNNLIWIGSTAPKEFIIPFVTAKRKNTYIREDGTAIAKFGNICWFTNLDLKKRHEEMILVRHYDVANYPKYDNYDAIEVGKLADIPCDYTGVMGVPITFMDKYCPEQFVILGRSGDLEWAENECTFYTPPSLEMQAKYKAMNKTWRVQNTYILDENGVPKITYGRIFIRYTSEWIANHPDDFKEVQQ